jgi:hypothetical protein
LFKDDAEDDDDDDDDDDDNDEGDHDDREEEEVEEKENERIYLARILVHYLSSTFSFKIPKRNLKTHV